MKRKSTLKPVLFALILAVSLGAYAAAKAESVSVSSFDGLESALTRSDVTELTVTITTGITLTGSIEVNSNIKKLTINFDGHTIDGDGHPFLTIKGGEVTLSNGAVKNCTSDDGAVIYCPDKAEVTLKDMVFTGNVAEIGSGGVAYMEGSDSKLTVTQCTFSQNGNEWFYGGAIYIRQNSTCSVSDSVFEQNYSEEGGGAIAALEGNTVTVTSCTFKDNVSNFAEGGAIFAADNTRLTISGTGFYDNEAYSQGGAVWQGDSETPTIGTGVLIIDECVFSGNKADDSGGAIQYKDLGSVTISDSSFSSNESDSGGAILVDNTKEGASFDDCSFEDNKADYSGGALKLFSKAELALSGCSFKNNQAEYCGGAISVSGGIVDYYDGPANADAYLSLDGTSTFSGNSAKIGRDIALDKSTADEKTGNAVIIISGPLGNSVYDVAIWDTDQYTHSPGVITEGLEGNGTVNNFKSSEGYAVIINDQREAELVHLSQCSVTFNANGGTGAMDKQTFTKNKEGKLKANAFKRKGYAFAGWNTKPDGSGTAYGDEAAVKLSGDITLYAQWKKKGSGFEDVAVPSKTFTFKKRWVGGSEKSIDFTLYKLGDTVYRHGFDKKAVSGTEWQYKAWFSEPVACYVLEKPVDGYWTRYENVGVYAGITDRCCNGGTIVNYRPPATGDDSKPVLWAGCLLASAALIIALRIRSKKKARG